MLTLFRSLCGALLITSFANVEAADPKLEKIDTPPSEEVVSAIREGVGQNGLRILLGDQVLMDIWLRTELPLKAESSEALGVNFGNLAEGTLVGVVRLHQEWRDYKNNKIAAGLYTLRYGIQPSDGNHMGVAQYRDYAMLLLAGDDTALDASLSHDEWVSKSYRSTKKLHPGLMALFPLYEDIAEPEIMKNEIDQWTLGVSLGALKMGMVFEGHGQLEGY
jgi:hypothetical protein